MDARWITWSRKRRPDDANATPIGAAHAFVGNEAQSACGRIPGFEPVDADPGIRRCRACEQKLGLGLSDASVERLKRARQIKALLAKGYTVAQCAVELSISTGAITDIMRDHGIKDRRSVKGKQSFDHRSAIERTVSELENAADSVRMLNLDPSGGDGAELDQWRESMDASLLIFKRLRGKIVQELILRRTSATPPPPPEAEVTLQEGGSDEA